MISFARRLIEPYMEKMLASAKEAIAWVKAKVATLTKKAEKETEELVSEVKDEEIFVAEAAKESVRRRWMSIRKGYDAFVGKLSARDRLVILFVIGILVGFGAKTIAASTVTIGYRDYTAPKEDAYDLIELQKKVAEGGGTGAFTGGVQPSGACSQ